MMEMPQTNVVFQRQQSSSKFQPIYVEVVLDTSPRSSRDVLLLQADVRTASGSFTSWSRAGRTPARRKLFEDCRAPPQELSHRQAADQVVFYLESLYVCWLVLSFGEPGSCRHTVAAWCLSARCRHGPPLDCHSVDLNKVILSILPRPPKVTWRRTNVSHGGVDMGGKWMGWGTETYLGWRH